MKTILRHLLTGVILTSLSAINSFAQSSDFDGFQRGSGPEARVTFTIPIGPKTRSAKDSSRLEFGIRQYQNRSNDLNWALNQNTQIYAQEYSESRIGITLGDENLLMLNGQEWHKMNTQLGLQDAEKAAVGISAVMTVVGAVVIAGVVVIVVSLDDDCYDCS